MRIVILFALLGLPAIAVASEDPIQAEVTNSWNDDWSLEFSWAQVIGSGSFSANSHVRAVSDYVGQSLGLSVSYQGLTWGEQSISLSLATSVDLEFSAPTHGGRRRFSLNDTTLRLSLPEFYKEPLSDIVFSAHAAFTMPTSVTSYLVKEQWLVASLGLAAHREVGLVDFTMGLKAAVFAHGSPVSKSYGLAPAGCGIPTSATLVEFTPTCDAQQVHLQAGFPNTFALVSTSYGVEVELFDHLSLAYHLGIHSYFHYGIPDDSLRAENATSGVTRHDFFSPSWTLSYPLSQKLDLPLDLTVTLDASAFHRVLSSDQSAVIGPWVFNTFGELAANGYGSLSLGFSGGW